MERKYYPPIITKNGRIALLTMKDFNAAVEEGKSILLICSGNALIIGADKISENNYSAYTASISEETFSITDFSRFYKIIITEGIKVYMKSGGPANYYNAEIGFYDDLTTFSSFIASPSYNDETELEFIRFRKTVDIESMKWYVNDDMWDAIKDMPCFEGDK